MRFLFKNTTPLILLLAFAVIPLLLGMAYALLYSLGMVGVLHDGFTLTHWIAVCTSTDVLLAFTYTIAISLVSILICVTLAAGITVLLGSTLRKGLTSYVVYIPLAFPGLVAAFFFFQFLSNSGLLSRLAYQVGIISSINSFPNLVNDKYGIGILIAQLFLSLPIFILLNVSILHNENAHALKVLAQSLGANKWQVLTKVTLPLLLRKSKPTILLSFIFKLGMYELPLLLGRSSPEAISVLTVRKMQRFNLLDIPQGYAIAVLYAILVFVLVTIVVKPNNNNVHG